MEQARRPFHGRFRAARPGARCHVPGGKTFQPPAELCCGGGGSQSAPGMAGASCESIPRRRFEFGGVAQPDADAGGGGGGGRASGVARSCTPAADEENESETGCVGLVKIGRLGHFGEVEEELLRQLAAESTTDDSDNGSACSNATPESDGEPSNSASDSGADSFGAGEASYSVSTFGSGWSPGASTSTSTGARKDAFGAAGEFEALTSTSKPVYDSVWSTPGAGVGSTDLLGSTTKSAFEAWPLGTGTGTFETGDAPAFGSWPPAEQECGPGEGGGEEAMGAGLAPGLVATGFYKGRDRGAALNALNVAFQHDLSQYIEDAAPDAVDLTGCFEQYSDLLAEIKG